MQTRQQLVVGTDFSVGAEDALETALELALAFDARLTVVHVCELSVDELDDRRLAQCRESLARVVARYSRAALDVRGVLRTGMPWTKLDNVAVEVGASLIVIGRQGLGCATGMGLGSVAQQLLRTANRPVLIVPVQANQPNQEEE